MSEFICNTSPLQYLHQLGLLDILPRLTGGVIVPPAVVDELNAGRSTGYNLPDPAAVSWITIRIPASAAALPLITDLGAGEREVLALVRENPTAIAILDDAAARRVAAVLAIRHRGTLGVLLDAKRARLVTVVKPILDQLQALGFRLDTRVPDRMSWNWLAKQCANDSQDIVAHAWGRHRRVHPGVSCDLPDQHQTESSWQEARLDRIAGICPDVLVISGL